jgi:hypothetical protein
VDVVKFADAFINTFARVAAIIMLQRRNSSRQLTLEPQSHANRQVPDFTTGLAAVKAQNAAAKAGKQAQMAPF